MNLVYKTFYEIQESFSYAFHDLSGVDRIDFRVYPILLRLLFDTFFN